MSMPGFVAETSLYRSSVSYRSAGAWTDPYGEPAVLPQLVLSCPHKGCGACRPDPTSSRGGRKCCCHPPFDPEFGCEPEIVECQYPPPPPPPPPRVDCGTHTCPPFNKCCGDTCCEPGHPCCASAGRCCPAGAKCCGDGDGCCPVGWACRSFFGWKFCSPV